MVKKMRMDDMYWIQRVAEEIEKLNNVGEKPAFISEGESPWIICVWKIYSKLSRGVIPMKILQKQLLQQRLSKLVLSKIKTRLCDSVSTFDRNKRMTPSQYRVILGRMGYTKDESKLILQILINENIVVKNQHYITIKRCSAWNIF